jgi:hypothetical protein
LNVAAVFPTSRYFNFLLGTARSLVDRQPEAAIATAQMAMESFVHFTFEELLKLHGIDQSLAKRLANLVDGSLVPPRTRELWRELTDGSTLDKAAPAAHGSPTESTTSSYATWWFTPADARRRSRQQLP